MNVNIKIFMIGLSAIIVSLSVVKYQTFYNSNLIMEISHLHNIQKKF